MNKLTKDQIQKLGLSAIGFVVLLYVYFSFFLGPLNKGRETAQRNDDDVTRASSPSSKTAKRRRRRVWRNKPLQRATFRCHESAEP